MTPQLLFKSCHWPYWGTMLNTALAVQTGQPHQYLLGRSIKRKLRVQNMAVLWDTGKFWKTGRRGNNSSGTLHFLQHQELPCITLHIYLCMVGRLWDRTVWRKTLTSTRKLYEFLHPLRPYTTFCMNYIIPHVAVGKWQMPQLFSVYSTCPLPKKKICATHSWCLKGPFQVPMEQTKFKRNPTMIMGMKRLSQILNRNSEKLFSVSLLSELGAVKAFSWAMKSPWNSTANLQTHSG